MDNRLSTCLRTIGCVVPSTMDGPKRFAKELKRFWPTKSLGACHEATAHVFGHADWHSLETSCARHARSAPLDEELGTEKAIRRFAAQRDIIAVEVGGLDPTQTYEPPKMPESLSSMSEEEFVQFLQAREALTDSRVYNALGRMSNAMCDALLMELSPTAQQRLPIIEVVDSADSVAPQGFIAELPARLAQWCQVNVPARPTIPDECRTCYWHKDRPVAILSFAAFWGSLNLVEARTIDFTMGGGTAYLLAHQFVEAMVAIQQPTREFSEAELPQAKFAMFSYFYSIYPRDDFIKMPPSWHRKNAEDVVKILSNPKSRRGTFKQ
jgi:hypothetical protein